MTMASITRKTGTNQGGNMSFFIIEAAKVTTIPAAVAGVISTDLTLEATFFWNQYEFTEETCQVTVPMVGEIDGESFAPRVQLQIAKDRAALIAEITELVGKRFIIAVKNNNGDVRLLGTLEQPMRMRQADTDTGPASTDRNHVLFAFEGAVNSACPMYTGLLPTS